MQGKCYESNNPTALNDSERETFSTCNCSISSFQNCAPAKSKEKNYALFVYCSKVSYPLRGLCLHCSNGGFY